jgi:hypothetical protein
MCMYIYIYIYPPINELVNHKKSGELGAIIRAQRAGKGYHYI